MWQERPHITPCLMKNYMQVARFPKMLLTLGPRDVSMRPIFLAWWWASWRWDICLFHLFISISNSVLLINSLLSNNEKMTKTLNRHECFTKVRTDDPRKGSKEGSSSCLPDKEAMYSVRECNLSHLKFTWEVDKIEMHILVETLKSYYTRCFSLSSTTFPYKSIPLFFWY